MNEARGAVAIAATHAEVADQGAASRRLAAITGRGALIGAVAGVVAAVPFAAEQGWAVFIATAIDVAAGLALIGGLIGANIAGTD